MHCPPSVQWSKSGVAPQTKMARLPYVAVVKQNACGCPSSIDQTQYSGCWIQIELSPLAAHPSPALRTRCPESHRFVAAAKSQRLTLFQMASTSCSKNFGRTCFTSKFAAAIHSHTLKTDPRLDRGFCLLIVYTCALLSIPTLPTNSVLDSLKTEPSSQRAWF